ncbi:hypothetical protein COOONC_11332 [Cooperia oncophora]
MPSKVQRAKKVLKTLSQPSSSSTSIVNSQSILSESANFENMSAMELIKNIMELNRDPAIENMLIALAEKIPKEFTDFLESDKRERSIVIAVNPIKADVLCLEIFSPPKATHFRFTVVYRPPNSTRREDDGLVDVLREMVSAQVNSIIVGDLNLQVDWKNLRADNASSAAFLDFFQESGLEQHVLQPTHGSNTLDLVLSTSHSIQNVSLLPPLAIPTMPPFASTDWLGLFNNYVSMDDIYRRFCKTVYKALTLFVPLKFPQRRPIKYPLHIRNLLAQKERLFRILDNPMSCPLYRKVCRDVDYHLKKFVSNLERHLGNQASLKRLHQYVRCKFKSKTPLPTLKERRLKHQVNISPVFSQLQFLLQESWSTVRLVLKAGTLIFISTPEMSRQFLSLPSVSLLMAFQK